MFKNVKCHAKDPSKCRYHGTHSTGHILTPDEVYAHPKGSFRGRELWEQQFKDRLVAKELTVTTDIDPTFYVTGSKDKGEWVQGFIKHTDGTPIGFIKIHYTTWKAGDGSVVYEGPVMCDIEVNPAYAGNNVALGVMRVVKNHFKSDHVGSGETFSKAGYRMFMKLRGHEEATGEVTVRSTPGIKEARIYPDPTDAYSFVHDWDTMTPKYPL